LRSLAFSHSPVAKKRTPYAAILAIQQAFRRGGPAREFTQAAEVLHVSASAIERQILQAEKALNAQLFEMLPSGLKLTAAGELLFSDLRRWSKEYSRTVERVDELRGLRRGHVGIALIDALSEGIVPATIAQLGEEYPQLTFDLRILDNRQVAEQVGAAEVDVGLLLEPHENAKLQTRAVAEIPIGVAVPIGHPLTTKPRVAIGQVFEFRQIVAAAPLIVHERAIALNARHHTAPPHFVSCNDVKTMRSLIRDGAGIGILSFVDVASDVAENRLAFLPLHGRQTKPLTLGLCVAPQRQLSRAANLVIDRLNIALKALAKITQAGSSHKAR
jgi:DNA-binding transcriptional LysR family regulator